VSKMARGSDLGIQNLASLAENPADLGHFQESSALAVHIAASFATSPVRRNRPCVAFVEALQDRCQVVFGMDADWHVAVNFLTVVAVRPMESPCMRVLGSGIRCLVS